MLTVKRPQWKRKVVIRLPVEPVTCLLCYIYSYHDWDDHYRF